MMDDKTATVGPTPPYEANPPVPAPIPQHSYSSADYPVSPNAPTQYPHQPIPPPGGQQYIHTQVGSPPPGGQQYIHTPAGSPPPMGHSPPPMGHSPPPMGSPPPQQPQQFIQPTSPIVSPGQEKHEFYTQQQTVPPPVTAAQQGSQYQTAVPLGSLQKSPAPVDCPNCRHRALTRVEYHAGNTTHVWAVVLFCLLCACCVPYLIKGTKDVEHKCGHCGTLLACYHASGHTEVLSYA